MEESLKDCIRPVNPVKDINLPRFSHSKLEVWENCNYRYNEQYNLKKYSNDTSLALEIGTLTHKLLELKGEWIKEGEIVDYEKLTAILEDGCEEISEKGKETIAGIKELKKRYFEEWYSPDNASGMNYDEKLEKFNTVLHREMEDDIWKPAEFELFFEFVWRDKYIISGFIDRLDIRQVEEEVEYRVCDYKSSKKVFDDKKLPTAQQMAIYGAAILNKYGKLPAEYKYIFTLIDAEQCALTKGWEKRIIKKLDKAFDAIAEAEKEGVYKPSPSPLCHWCAYCSTNPNATKYKYECPYYSLWTPDNKVFATNQQWSPEDVKHTTKLNEKETKRKLVF